jgi:hypothetical protein
MWKLFALLAITLIASGLLLVAVPRTDPVDPNARSAAPDMIGTVGMINQARDVAEQVNAPLSIVFGLVSLFYSRRSYIVNKERADAAKIGRST